MTRPTAPCLVSVPILTGNYSFRTTRLDELTTLARAGAFETLRFQAVTRRRYARES